MDKKISFIWSLGVGLLFVVSSLVIFLTGFGDLNIESPLVNFVIIFLSGTLVGAVLVYLLRQSERPIVFRATVIAFVISLPFALFGLVFGGIVGGIGLFLLGVSPSVFITGTGHYLGRAFSRK
jgi:uncharacterized membrane protein YjjP (DUF1212 family)